MSVTNNKFTEHFYLYVDRDAAKDLNVKALQDEAKRQLKIAKSRCRYMDSHELQNLNCKMYSLVHKYRGELGRNCSVLEDETKLVIFDYKITYRDRGML